MDSNFMQFDLLARETLELSKNLTPSLFEGEDLDFKPSFESFRPNGPGILYRIVMGGSTFSLRGIATENIKETFEELEAGDEAIHTALKLEEDSQVFHFRTDFVEQAEIIMDGLFQRRFPIYEDMLCNLSDPGYSWWMEKSNDRLVIYFKSQTVDRENELLKLGPIGDHAIASRRFAQLGKNLKKLFALREFSVDDRRLVIEPVDKENTNFKAVMNLFVKGSAPTAINGFSPTEFDRTLFYYLSELSTLRSFWLEVEPRTKKHRSAY